MRALLSAVLPLFAAMAAATQDVPSSTAPAPACTATSSTGSGAFFDLRPDIAVVPDDSKSHKAGVAKDYYARGYDYGQNFTINICAPVIEPVSDVMGVKESAWPDVGAYYASDGSVYSIGSKSLDLQSRGRKLVLQYVDGSPCGGSSTRPRDAPTYDYYGGSKLASGGDEDGYNYGGDGQSADTGTRRKSTTISFLCDRDPGNTQASVSFVGADPEECAYFFEARSIHACAQAEPHKPGSVGPGSVFGLILVIAVLVYVLGGVFYNRTVAHARGWRQLPNYSLWASIWGFICDMFVIFISSCSRHLPRRRGYSHVSSSPPGRNRNAEEENRLIDQLDEEWDD